MANARTRIYDQQEYADLFEGHLKSREFKPVEAVDTSKSIEQQAQRKINDVEMLARGAQRQYVLDDMYLRTSNELDQARRKAKLDTFNGLLKLSSTALNAYSSIKEIIDKNQDEHKQLDSLGVGLNNNTQIDPKLQQIADENKIAIRAETKAVGEVAEEIEQEGTPEAVGIAHGLRETTVYNSLKASQNNVHSAISIYPAYLTGGEVNVRNPNHCGRI